MEDVIPDSPLHQGLYEVHVPVTDLARSIAFYAKLGFHLGFGSEGESGALLLFEAGDTRWMLGLYRLEEVSHRHPAESHIALRVPEARIDDVIPDLERRGIEPVHPPHAPLQGRMREPIVHGWMPAAAVFFRDPDGHLLELIAELRAAPRPEVVYQPLSKWREQSCA
jgi:catechol 2,3-dioxygenase-like lactoylglutathione lyase family enzyme